MGVVPMWVKALRSSEIFGLEKKINDFIQAHSQYKIIDIKFSIHDLFYAIIVYEEED